MTFEAIYLFIFLGHKGLSIFRYIINLIQVTILDPKICNTKLKMQKFTMKTHYFLFTLVKYKKNNKKNLQTIVFPGKRCYSDIKSD